MTQMLLPDNRSPTTAAQQPISPTAHQPNSLTQQAHSPTQPDRPYKTNSWVFLPPSFELPAPVRGLFEHERFRSLAQRVCPPEKQLLDRAGWAAAMGELQMAVGRKLGNPKMGCPAKWKQRLKPVVPRWFNFYPYPNGYGCQNRFGTPFWFAGEFTHSPILGPVLVVDLWTHGHTGGTSRIVGSLQHQKRGESKFKQKQKEAGPVAQVGLSRT